MKIIRQGIIFAVVTVCSILALSLTASALTPEESAALAKVNTSSVNVLSIVVYWIVRAAILGAGGIPSLLKVVSGVSDENPRDRNGGIVGLIVTGSVFAATFIVEALMSANTLTTS